MTQPNKKDNKLQKKNTPTQKSDSISSIIDPLNELKNDSGIKEEIINQNFITSEQKRDTQKKEEITQEKLSQENEEELIVGDITDVINNNAKISELTQKTETLMSGGKVIDININSIDDIFKILINKELDIFTLEPKNDTVKVSIKDGKQEKYAYYIKYPTYTNILLKAKALTGLVIEDTKNVQNGEGGDIIRDAKYKFLSKTVPSKTGEKLFFKIEKLKAKVVATSSTKTSGATIFSFLLITTIVALIIGGSFISFVVMNANTLEDVQFFQSIGVNLNDINEFIRKTINIIFSILIFAQTIFLIIYLFKTLLTKKNYRRKKIAYGVISFFLLIITFATGSAWLVVDAKVQGLPNWQEMAYGDVQVYDNSKLISDQFTKESSLLTSTSNLIGPVTLKYDLTYWDQQEKRTGFSSTRFIWTFGGEVINESSPVMIKKITDVGIYDVSLKIIGTDNRGNEVEKTLDINSVNVVSAVEVIETELKSGGKTVRFNAKSLQNLGKIDWYFIEQGKLGELKSSYTGFDFQPGKVIVEDTLIGMSINYEGEKSQQIDKIFLIQKSVDNTIEGDIEYTRDSINDLKYTFKVNNPKTEFGNGFIETFSWNIGNTQQIITADIDNQENSSEYVHEFSKYGDHTISVELKDSQGKIKILEKTINIPKRLHLQKGITITNESGILGDNTYDQTTNEYFINNIPAPTTLKLDASLIKSSDPLYTLQSVSWDTNSDGIIDNTGYDIEYSVDTEGFYTIEVMYIFNRKFTDETMTLSEKIGIKAIKKDAIISLNIEPESTYVPTYVSFDASKSSVEGKNIDKFIYDYGDGIIEERDAINPGHKYISAGEYNIKLTVVTTDGNRFSTEKKLILKPKPQSAKIVTSMKKAPIDQGIDFSSTQSEGQITGYYWEFGDGNVSVEANPTHAYNKEGDYRVTLKLTFINNNILTDELDIVIQKK